MTPLPYTLLGVATLLLATAGFAERPKNVLFIAVDDLRPELAVYGESHIKSPHIDALAGESLLFKNAYTSVATCGASRASMMSGIRPTRTRFVYAKTHVDKDAPGAATINSHFKDNGYRTISMGKIYHYPSDNRHGWSEAPWNSRAPKFFHPENRAVLKYNTRGVSVESADVADEYYADGDLALAAIEKLEELATTPEQPFFLAIGFRKPHLPFVAPQKYWDMYPEESIRLPDNYKHPENAPKAALHNFGELRNYEGVPDKDPISDEQAKELIRGYYACVSYIDAQIGKVLAGLEAQGLEDDTIVVLWGDHGWNLGDHLLWCKHSTFESSLRIPLMFKVPGLTDGEKTEALAESVDIFATLCDLTGIDTPTTVEGASLVPVMKFPNRSWNLAAFSRFRKGDSVRTQQYRYSEFHHEETGAFLGRTLFDLEADPLENINIADKPEMAETVEELAALLKRVQGATAP